MLLRSKLPNLADSYRATGGGKHGVSPDYLFLIGVIYSSFVGVKFLELSGVKFLELSGVKFLELICVVI